MQLGILTAELEQLRGTQPSGSKGPSEGKGHSEGKGGHRPPGGGWMNRMAEMVFFFAQQFQTQRRELAFLKHV